MKSKTIVLLFACASSFQAVAQDLAKPAVAAFKPPQPESPVTDSRYRIGTDDEVLVWVGEMPELSQNAGRAFNVDANGYVNIPMAGRLKIAGLTTAEAERRVAGNLVKYLKNPQVNISLSQVRSRPVSVVGSVNQPGVHQIRGHAPLLEVIALAGGLRNDAGSSVTLTRPLANGAIPLPFAENDASGNYSVAEINLDSIMRGDHPEYNTTVFPNDVVSVRRAEMVYVVGEVSRSGGFVLNEKKSISVLQALSLAGGINATAAPGKSKIIRGANQPPEKREEIAVDLKRILGGKQEDLALYPDDILFVPDSSAKKIATRSAEAILQTITGVVIFRSGR